MDQKLLEVQNLVIEFNTDRGKVRAVDDISFTLNYGETLGIVGESGCGKTVTALSLLKLIPSPPGKIVRGKITYQGEDIVPKSESHMRRLRGKEISMIFQEPMTSLNPVLTIGNQMIDVIRKHTRASRSEAKERAIKMLKQIQIPSPERRLGEYSHQISGGMRQRVMIAMALSCNPKILIADEPTTALDVTVQAQVMAQISELQKKFNTAVILVTHDLGVIAETCTKVIVMYCGRIVERADVYILFERPRHPYTRGLLLSIPKIREKKLDKLPTIEGTVPDLCHLPTGCRFADRCEKVQDRCRQEDPPLEQKDDSSEAACFYPY
jgi:oligopeptide/dipeptide ABC transporter ATP-binding protein